MSSDAVVVRLVLGAAVVACLATCAGCGYTLGFQAPERVRSVAVPMFLNETFPLRRELEVELTRAVKQELEIRSDLRLTDKEHADAVLLGTIRSFRQGVLTETTGDVTQDASIRINVGIRLERRADGALLVDGLVEDHEAFSVETGETIEDARRRAVEQLAARIVAHLEEW